MQECAHRCAIHQDYLVTFKGYRLIMQGITTIIRVNSTKLTRGLVKHSAEVVEKCM